MWHTLTFPTLKIVFFQEQNRLSASVYIHLCATLLKFLQCVGVNAPVSLAVFKITKTRCHELREETWRILLQMTYSTKLETTWSWSWQKIFLKRRKKIIEWIWYQITAEATDKVFSWGQCHNKAINKRNSNMQAAYGSRLSAPDFASLFIHMWEKPLLINCFSRQRDLCKQI